MKIIKVYTESMPRVKLIGKRYTDKDRNEAGSFASHWQQWFHDGWFDILKQCASIPEISEDYVGAIRMMDDGFEYWIGALFSPHAQIPDGFESEELPAGELGICWLYGDEKTGELFSMEASDLAMAALAQKCFNYSESGWFFERYNFSRFMSPDEHGNVILDICAYLV